jgi:serine/threonine protein kinase
MLNFRRRDPILQWPIDLAVSDVSAEAEHESPVKKEISLLRSFRHLHSIMIHGSYNIGKSVFLLLELCDTTLGEILLDPPPWFQTLPPAKVFSKLLNWMLNLASAIHSFHAKNSMHRDIKTENILIKGTHIYLSDFSLATQSESPFLRPASVSGTERYKAPEMGSTTTYTHKSDIFLLGYVYVEMLTVANNMSTDTFKNCHRSEHACYRHNLNAEGDFVQKYFKRTKGVDFIIGMIMGQMLSQVAFLRPSAEVGLYRGTCDIPGFKKEDCCESIVKRAGYDIIRRKYNKGAEGPRFKVKLQLYRRLAGYGQVEQTSDG